MAAKKKLLGQHPFPTQLPAKCIPGFSSKLQVHSNQALEPLTEQPETVQLLLCLLQQEHAHGVVKIECTMLAHMLCLLLEHLPSALVFTCTKILLSNNVDYILEEAQTNISDGSPVDLADIAFPRQMLFPVTNRHTAQLCVAFANSVSRLLPRCFVCALLFAFSLT